jgi:hypothetical protein
VQTINVLGSLPAEELDDEALEPLLVAFRDCARER